MAASILSEKSAKYETISNEIFYMLQVTLVFLRSLITNKKSKFENSPIQYGGSNIAAPILAEKLTKRKQFLIIFFTPK